MISSKVMAHMTRVEFGEVCARLMLGGGWAITFDARGVRQGARMIEEGLSFEKAVMGAYRVWNAPSESNTVGEGTK